MKSSWRVLGGNLEQNILEKLLKNRAVKPKDYQQFLDPPPPTLAAVRKILKIKKVNLDKAVAVIQLALDQNRPIVIHGDYDVDGIVSTAILWKALYRILRYKNCQPFIPNRFDHGYGLSKESIDEIVKSLPSDAKGTPLLITVDCGITAVDEVAYAQTRGFEALVVDHHSPPPKLPDCSLFYSDQVCAAGLAWILVQALGSVTGSDLDLAALATVADLQPLTGFNRSLVKFGLLALTDTKNVGLKVLMKEAGLTGRAVGTFEIGWVIAPRINASGRLESAWESLRLLCTGNIDQATQIAHRLNDLNAERQEMTKAAVELALELNRAVGPSKVSVVAHEQFHEGLIGLVAGRLVSHLGVPAVVISKGVEFSKASARSVEGFNIVEFLRSLGDHFEDVGGHAGAAGFTIRTERLTAFLQALKSGQADLQMPIPNLVIDGVLDFKKIDPPLLADFKKLAPFGLGNREPLFLTQGIKVENFYLVGSDKSHLKLLLSSSGKTFSAIYFGKAQILKELKIGDKIDLVYNLSNDEWNGQKSISLKVRDLDIAN